MNYRFIWPDVKSGLKYKVYSTDDCMKCPARAKCTNSVRGRWITRWVKEKVEEEHWKRMKLKGSEKMALRKRTVEHPFGTIKRAMNQGYLLMKGLRKVSGEFGFSALTYNIKRAITIKGVEALTNAFT